MTKHFTTRFLLVLALVVMALALLTTGCKKKAPKEPPPPPPDTTHVEEVTPPPAPDTTGNAARERQAAMQADMGRIQTIYFDYDKFNIRADQQARLSSDAEIFRRWTEWQISVEGNCDQRGTPEYNLALGERRATSTKQALVAAGVDGGRISTVSYGEERPVVANPKSEDDYQQNRRCEFKVK